MKLQCQVCLVSTLSWSVTKPRPSRLPSVVPQPRQLYTLRETITRLYTQVSVGVSAGAVSTVPLCTEHARRGSANDRLLPRSHSVDCPHPTVQSTVCVGYCNEGQFTIQHHTSCNKSQHHHYSKHTSANDTRHVRLGKITALGAHTRKL